MAYFNQIPNIQYVNRFKNSKSNDETTEAKNLFRRTKLREDLESIFTSFDFYAITDGERPDTIAKKLYGDPELDWVIRVVNNVQNYYDDWPLDNKELHNYLIEKYGSEEKLLEVHHYETIQTTDNFGRLLLPGGLEVDKSYYDAPQYETVTTPPAGVVFPVITLPGIAATITPTVSNFRVTGATISSAGRGYTKTPIFGFSPPPATVQATVNAEVTDFHISGFSTTVGFNTGSGYRIPPSVAIESPPDSIQSTATATITSGKLTAVTVDNGGLGYGLTVPTVQIGLPPNYVVGSRFEEKSPIGVGSDVDGMMVKPDGYKIYTSSMSGTNQVKEFFMTTPWDISTINAGPDLDVSAQFSYCNGITIEDNGSRLYVTGGKSGVQKVAYYQLVIPWSLSSVNYSQSLVLDAPGGVRFKSDGTKMFILDGNNPDSIKVFDLSTAWDITTANLTDTVNIGNLVQDNDLVGFSFGDDGKKLYFVGQDSGSVHGFNLEDAYEVEGVKTLTESVYVGNRVSVPSDIFIQEDTKEKIWIMGGDDKVGQFQNRSKGQAKAFINSVGVVTTINVTQAGFGYTETPSVTIGVPFTSVGAAATAIITAGENGSHVTSFVISQAGFGYTTTPTVTIGQPPIFRTATGIVSVTDGQISSVIIKDQGENYYDPPTVSLSVEPEDIVNTEVGDLYTVNNKVYRWGGVNWELQLTKAFEYMDSQGVIQELKGNKISKPVSIYEYETLLNETKRLIKVPKPEYIPLIQDDFRRAMKYDVTLDTTINEYLTRAYNPKLSGI